MKLILLSLINRMYSPLPRIWKTCCKNRVLLCDSQELTHKCWWFLPGSCKCLFLESSHYAMKKTGGETGFQPAGLPADWQHQPGGGGSEPACKQILQPVRLPQLMSNGVHTSCLCWALPKLQVWSKKMTAAVFCPWSTGVAHHTVIARYWLQGRYVSRLICYNLLHGLHLWVV